MFVPYNVDVPMERWPYANWALIGLTCLVSLAILANPPRRAEPIAWVDEELDDETLEQSRQALADPPVPALALARERFRVWQPFTYVLVHADLLHLAGNMIFLFCFGNAINARLGHALFLVFYFLLGAAAGLAWLLLDSGLALVGASGAIMGIVGLFFVLYPLNNVNVFYWLIRPGVLELSSCWVILFYLLWDLFGTVMGSGDGVAYVCHLGGAALGIACGVALFATGILEPVYHERNLLQVMGWQEEAERPRRDPVGDLPLAGKKRRRPPAQEDEMGWGG